MVHTHYKISKFRFGQGGEWGSWEYAAVSDKSNYISSDPAERGITSRYQTIDALAKELATFPGITNAEFVPDVEYAPKLSLSVKGKGILTQRGIISDEELGELGVLILKYVSQ